MVIILGVVFLIVLFLIAGWIASSVASANQSQAIIEVARVSQIQATENLVQSANATLLTIGLLVAFAALIGLVIYLIWRDRKREREMRDLLLQMQLTGAALPTGKWAPGPNARFRRTDQPALPAVGGLDNQIVQLLLINKLLDNRRGGNSDDGRHDQDPFQW